MSSERRRVVSLRIGYSTDKGYLANHGEGGVTDDEPR